MSQPIRKVPRPERWQQPFDPAMGDTEVARILAVDPFATIDPQLFPPRVPLHGILRNDARIRRFGPGDLVCVRGEYGSSAFFVLGGEVRVIVGEGLPESMLGRAEPRRIGWLQALGQLWRNHPVPEVREIGPRLAVATSGAEQETRLRLERPQPLLDQYETVPLTAGQLFGEIAALARVPRNATVMVAGEAELLEIRWQGLRELRRHSREFRALVDGLYRSRSLLALLLETPLLRDLDQDALQEIAHHARFESYGDFEWHAGYRQHDDRPAVERIAEEPLIAEEGHYPDGVLLVSGGFARVTERRHSGHKTVGLLRRGDLFGLEEARNDGPAPGSARLRYSLRALGYVDLVRLPLELLQHHVFRHTATRPIQAGRLDGAEIDQELLEFFVEHRYINGTATMLVDLDRCVRCDDCVRACSLAHDGNPRFLREGRKLDRFMVAEACMHCTDPVCMIGCPTGAIHRDRASGMIVIADPICVGCGSCASSCPFRAIRMVEVHDPAGGQLVDDAGTPLLKATKCDLCIAQPVAAQCERACPHDALRRVDMRDLQALDRWLQR